MPELGNLGNIIATLLQYAILAFLYYFLYQMLRVMENDLPKRRSLRFAKGLSAALYIVDDGGLSGLPKQPLIIGEALSIGRSPCNDVILNDTYVSHQHAVIQRSGTQYLIEDLNSSNQSYINGTAVAGKTYLKNGDFIQIGLVTFRFER